MLKVSALDMPDVPKGHLPEHLETQRTRVVCKADAPIHTEGITYSGSYASMGVDNSLRFQDFKDNFRIEVVKLTDEMIEFDMSGIDAAIANAFRRILIAEVPTMAIEKVLVANNTSVIADEVLAHRLGLLPLEVDPRLFEFLSENDVPNERNTIVFKLKVTCDKSAKESVNKEGKSKKSQRITVKSDQMKWLPNGSEFIMETPNPSSEQKSYTAFSCSQASMPEFSGKPPGMKDQDIIIAKLGPGQAIELEAHAVKGVGKEHAKWSPVATAWYRMLPEVILKKEVNGVDAEKLVQKCPVNVFDIEDIGHGEKKVVVLNPRACTLCRECIRGVGEDLVELRRIKNHFIFTIESVGALPPEVLFTEAVKILLDKCDRVISELS